MRAFLAGCFLFALSCSSDPTAFHDVESQTAQFMAWDASIELTASQEEVKKAALEAIPAPCCGDNSAYTCCCPCNLSRSIWGLSKRLITERNAGAVEVREAVQEWIAFVNPDGFSGDVCYKPGGCPRPFAKNGCGGMNPNQVNF